MKRFLVIFISALAFIGNLSAVNQDSVTLELRNKAYKRYRLVKDTTTIRTWMNMDRMNKALIEVVEYDNELLQTYNYADSALATDAQSSPDTLVSRQPEEFVKPVLNLEFDRDYLLFALAASIILAMIFLVLLIFRTINLRQTRQTLDESEEIYNSKIKRMEFLDSEVKKMKSRENEIKAELEKGIIDYQAKMQQLRQRIDELASENTRLESLLASHPGVDLSEENKSAGETVAIKHELIEKLETMLQRLKDIND